MSELSAMAGSEGYEARDDEGTWQRQLTDNAIYAAKHLDCLRPLSVERPAQEPEQAEPVLEPMQEAGSGWGFYIIADLKTWADNAEARSPLECYPSFERAKARFEELRGEPYNSEAAGPGPDGQPPARLTLGLESADGMSAADILHVRQGENYLVTDFTRMEQLRDDPAVMDILARVSREIGFDWVRVFEQADGGRQTLSVVPFAEWDNPYFASATLGRIAAQYCDLLHQCYHLPKNDALRKGEIVEIIQFIRQGGGRAGGQLKVATGTLQAGQLDDAAVQGSASALRAELDQYRRSGETDMRQQKPKHRKSQER